MHAAEHTWQSEDNRVGQFSLVGKGDGTQVIKLGSECLYALSYLTGTQEEIPNGRSRKWEILNNGVQSHRGFPFPSVFFVDSPLGVMD